MLPKPKLYFTLVGPWNVVQPDPLFQKPWGAKKGKKASNGAISNINIESYFQNHISRSRKDFEPDRFLQKRPAELKRIQKPPRRLNSIQLDRATHPQKSRKFLRLCKDIFLKSDYNSKNRLTGPRKVLRKSNWSKVINKIGVNFWNKVSLSEKQL